jgi:molecular chaperone IbpA
MVIFHDPFITNLTQEFEKILNLNQPTKATYPPHNVIKIDDDEFVMEFAVAGFTKKDIQLTSHKGVLSVKGEKVDKELPKDAIYLHKGIAARKFIRNFNLPEHTEVLSAKVEDGILSITLVRSVPEEQKPKTYTVK